MRAAPTLPVSRRIGTSVCGRIHPKKMDSRLRGNDGFLSERDTRSSRDCASIPATSRSCHIVLLRCSPADEHTTDLVMSLQSSRYREKQGGRTSGVSDHETACDKTLLERPRRARCARRHGVAIFEEYASGS